MLFSKKLLEGLFFPNKDQIEVSKKKFPDKSDYKIEVPTINSFETLRKIISLSKEKKIKINKITETKGIFLYTTKEIQESFEICRESEIEFCMSVGPRAVYDLSPTMLTKDGSRIGYRLRGTQNIARALEDILRAMEIGIKSFVIYDEGLLYVISKLKKENKIPNDLKIKISAHCGYSNPFSIKILEEMGATSVNPVRDLSLEMISSIRSFIHIPLDIHSDNPKSSGGFIRFYDVPEIIKIASPVYIKVGNSALENHGALSKESDAINIFRNIEIVQEMIKRYNPSAVQSKF